MKIKRYHATDMRQALRMVQQELGPDAVILSSEDTGRGVELVAATDYDEALIHQARREPRPAPEGRPEPTAATPAAASQESGQSQAAIEAQLESMREMLESRLDAVSAAYRGKCPGRRAAHSLLLGLGLKPAQATEIAEALPAGQDAGKARKLALHVLARKLPVYPGDPLQDGGALAVFGPTGVGKTTTIAKLAARHIMRHGRGSVQLVGTDEYRIGAQEQLGSYARILGAPLHRARSADDLDEILANREPQDLILIDTAGVGARDLVLHQQFDVLEGRHRVRRALCLSAATSAADLAFHASRFAQLKADYLVMTKLDETRQLGVALSYLLSQSAPLLFVTNGQQVPEDLELARGLDLVQAAIPRKPQAAKTDREHPRAA